MDSIHEKILAFNYGALEGGDDMENKQLAFDIQDMSGDTIIEEEPKAETNDDIAKSLGINARWFWEDPEILDEKAKATINEMAPYDRPRFIVELTDRYFKKYPEFAEFEQVTIWQDPEQLLELFRSVTLEDLEKNVLVKSRKDKAAKIYEHLQQRLNEIEESDNYGNPEDVEINKQARINPNDIHQTWPIITIRYDFTLSELRKLYYLKNPRISSKELAKEQGAIMTIGGHLADISNKDYSGWLDEVPNGTAYLSYVGPNYWDNVETDAGGNIYEGDEARVLRAVREQDAKVKREFKAGTFGADRPPEHERINKELMNLLLKCAYENNGKEVTLYMPALVRELNPNYKIDIDEYENVGELNEKGRQNKEAAEKREKEAAEARKKGEKVYTKERPSIMQQFYSLDYWAGVLDSNEITRTAIITGFNKEAQTISFYFPYISKVIQRKEEQQRLEAERNRRAFVLPSYNFLVHSSIESERNKLAVDLVYTIIDKLLQRGTKTASEFKENQLDADTEEKKAGEKVVYRIKYSTLIKDTPLLENAYKNANNADKKYKVITRTFKKAFQLLHKKTDLYEYFINLDIPEMPPTVRTLDNQFVITHNGRNPNYKAK